MDTRLVVISAHGSSAANPLVRLLTDLSGNHGIQAIELSAAAHEVRKSTDRVESNDAIPDHDDDEKEKEKEKYDGEQGTNDKLRAAADTNGPPPLFLVRDPIRVFDEWKFDGRDKTEFFITSYRKFLEHVETVKPTTVLFEKFATNPVEQCRDVCDGWGLSYDEQAGRVWNADFNLPCRGALTNEEKEQVEEGCCRLYLHYWGEEATRLHKIFGQKTWFGFDLDDTLHEFRYASGEASVCILKSISSRLLVPLPQLQEAYSRILKDKTKAAFTDGKTSRHYRRERFLALMGHFTEQWKSVKESVGQDLENDYLEKTLDLYETTLSKSLQLKCGALTLMAHLKQLGKKIAIFTEGPQDAQERTLRELGLEDYVDYLATTNKLGVSKVDGMFRQALRMREINADDMVYIGDSWDRDMQPAMAEGILCVFLNETANVCLSSTPPSVNTLSKIDHLLML
jgi:FMN phosphatase YigB (HAD superfamily)